MEYLAQEQKEEFIAMVSDPALPGIFNADLCAVRVIPYPFYTDGKLYTLENMSVAPPFSLDYFQSGGLTVYLDGSPEPFSMLNEAGLLILNDDTIIDYLEFYCYYVTQKPEDILILRNAQYLPFQDPIFIDFHFDRNNYTEKDIKPSRTEDGGYIVHSPFIFNGKIDRAIASVSKDGKVSIAREHPR